jgi:hypothetical protein
MDLFWQKSFSGNIKISDISNVVVGTFNSSSFHTKIEDLLFYTEQNSELDTLIVAQDSSYNRSIAIYRRTRKFLGLINSVTITIDDLTLTFVHENRSSAYLEIDRQIIASYTSDNGWFRQSGTITIYNYDDKWQLLLYSLLYAVKYEDNLNISA